MAQSPSDTPFLFDVEKDLFQDLFSRLHHTQPQSGFDELHLYGLEELGKQGRGKEEISLKRWRAQKDYWQKLGDIGREEADILPYGSSPVVERESRGLISRTEKKTGFEVAAYDDITGLNSVHAGSKPPSVAEEWRGQLDRTRNEDHAKRSLREKEQIDWTECPNENSPTKQCATLQVPLNYERPNQGSVNIAMARIPATGKKPIGSLFMNPGGPGGSGLDALDSTAQRYSDKIKKKFHIVTWDPRGIGQTTPTLQSCQQLFPVLDETGKVNWNDGLKKSRNQWRKANQSCQNQNSEFINHLGTRNVVRDLNRMRQAVGDPKLTFHGKSYGTRIGYTYAEMYPNNVRALVLDGNVNPSGDFTDLARSAFGADLALDFVGKNDRSVAKAFKSGDRILGRRPIELKSGEQFTRWDYREFVTSVLAESAYDQIEKISELVRKANGSGKKSEEAKVTFERIKKPYNSNAGGIFSVVNSIDYSDRPSKIEQADMVKSAVSKGPLSGSLALSYAAAWVGFDLDPDPVPNMSLKQNKAKVADIPVVIVNATKDTYTPKFWAKKMNRVFKNKAFIQQKNTKHCIWSYGDPCVDRPIDMFILKAKVPNSKICPRVDV